MTTPRPTSTLADPPGGCGPAWERPGARPAARGSRLALFDLDHTLLSGDSDVLWCEFLMAKGVLARAGFEARNDDMARRYADASVTAQAFCDFYVSTLAGRSLAEWQPLCAEFLSDVVAPRIPASAHALVDAHRQQGHTLLLTTATNRVITEQTAAHLGIPDLIATDVALSDGVCTGRTAGTLNMREGKVERLQAWLRSRSIEWRDCDATFYSDSINDLPLLAAVQHPVATNPDAMLAAEAAQRGWPVVRLHARR
jgi:HAD superfamily hydrolase (TIGR01490 family)